MLKGLRRFAAILIVGVVVCSALHVRAQFPDDRPGGDRPFPPRDGFGRGGPGGVQAHTKLVQQFDKDGDKRLNAGERKAAREFLQKEKAEGRGPRRPGFRGPQGESSEPPAAGVRVSPSDVKAFPAAAFYDPSIVRTFFLEFDNADWEKELSDFYHTDVEVPAKVTVDG